MWLNCGCSGMFLQKYWSTLFSLTYFCISPVLTMPHATAAGCWKSFDDTSCILLPCFEKKWSHGIIQLTVSFYLSLKHEPHFWFSVLALSIAIIILFYFSFLGSSSFSHTWMFIRRQLRFWRFIQKAYCLYVWWRIIQLTLCCKNIWNRTQTKTF